MDEYLDAWMAAAGIGDDKKDALFWSFKKGDKLTSNPMMRSDVLYMIKRRAKGPASPTPPVALLFGPCAVVTLRVEDYFQLYDSAHYSHERAFQLLVAVAPSQIRVCNMM